VDIICIIYFVYLLVFTQYGFSESYSFTPMKDIFLSRLLSSVFQPPNFLETVSVLETFFQVFKKFGVRWKFLIKFSSWIRLLLWKRQNKVKSLSSVSLSDISGPSPWCMLGALLSYAPLCCTQRYPNFYLICSEELFLLLLYLI